MLQTGVQGLVYSLGFGVVGGFLRAQVVLVYLKPSADIQVKASDHHCALTAAAVRSVWPLLEVNWFASWLGWILECIFCLEATC